MIKPTDLQREMRETLKKLENAEIEEQVAETALHELRKRRRLIQWQLRDLEAIEEELEEYAQADQRPDNLAKTEDR